MLACEEALATAGVNVDRTKTAFVQNMLETPKLLADFEADEVVLLEERVCHERSSHPGRDLPITILPVSDDRLRLSC